ncbi:MAG: hypothetical protein LCI02_18565 [Proteobacteria bacterium]|nr:hypothetical protein [Pseudomonadota bacterium]
MFDLVARCDGSAIAWQEISYLSEHLNIRRNPMAFAAACRPTWGNIGTELLIRRTRHA